MAAIPNQHISVGAIAPYLIHVLALGRVCASYRVEAAGGPASRDRLSTNC